MKTLLRRLSLLAPLSAPLLGLLLVGQVHAADAAAPQTLPQTAPPAASAVSPARLALAQEMMALTMADGSAEAIIGAVQRNLLTDPRMRAYEDVINAWFRKVVDLDRLSRDIALVYAERFTEQELRDMVAFYRSPTGKKLIRETPVMMEQTMNVGRSWAQANMPLLFEMIRQRQEEMKSQAEALMPPSPKPGDT